MIDFNKTFETDRVIIRPMQMDDFAEMQALTTDSDQWIYFTSDLSVPTELEAWIRSGVEDETRLAMTVIDRASGAVIGSTSIGNVSPRDRRAEIGWTWVCKSHHGKGFNRHVKVVLLRYLFEDCALERVEFKTDVLNTAARKAMQKIGLVEEGILRSHTQMTRNRRRDSIFYSALKTDWPVIKAQNQ